MCLLRLKRELPLDFREHREEALIFKLDGAEAVVAIHGQVIGCRK